MFLTMANNSARQETYNSHFISEFAHIQTLGKGGFGVVFKAVYKLADIAYAIKRIPLDKTYKADEKAMREVKTLASLEHSNIVRYFNSWIETPTAEWQEEQDNILLKGLSIEPDDCSEEELEFCSESENKKDKHFGHMTKSNKSSQTDGQYQSLINNNKKKKTKGKSEVSNSIGRQLPSVKEDIVKPLKTSKINKNSLPLNSYFIRDNDNDLHITFEKQCDIGSSDKKYSSSSSTSRICYDSSDETSDEDLHRFKREGIAIVRPQKGGKPNVGTPSGNKIQNTQIMHNKRNTTSKKKSKLCSFLYIQMELCQNDNLRDWLNQNNSEERDMEESFRIFSQILKAIEFIHEKGIIHRDLKPSNIFFSIDGTVKVGDFGLAKTMIKDVVSQMHNEETGSLTAEVGTQPYMSPEQLACKKYDQKVDVYSLGLIFLELLQPYGTTVERYISFTAAKNGTFDQKILQKYLHELNLIKLMIKENPEDRLTTKEIRQKLNEGTKDGSGMHIKRAISINPKPTSRFEKVLDLSSIIYKTKWKICIPIIIYHEIDQNMYFSMNYTPEAEMSYYTETAYFTEFTVSRSMEARRMREIPPLKELQKKALAVVKLNLYHLIQNTDSQNKNKIIVKKQFAKSSKKQFPQNRGGGTKRTWYVHVRLDISRGGSKELPLDWFIKLEYYPSNSTSDAKIIRTGISKLPLQEQCEHESASVLTLRLPFIVRPIQPSCNILISYTGTIQPMMELSVTDCFFKLCSNVSSKKRKRKRKKNNILGKLQPGKKQL